MDNFKYSILYLGNKLSCHGFTPTGVETLGNRLKQITKVYTSSNKKNKLFRLFDMLFSIIKYRKKIDIIFIDFYSGLAFFYGIFCSVIARLLNIRYIPIIRGGNISMSIRKYFWISTKIFNKSYLNIAPSKYIEKVFHNYDYKIQYLPNYIELKNYDFKVRRNCKPKLLWVRSFHKVYNPKMAIKVLDKLLKIYPNAELCMVGPEKDGMMASTKELAESLKIRDHIIFTGLLTKKQWVDLSSSYDIFINTTNFDNMPVSVMEAMALGFPIVSTNVAGLKYLHQDKNDALLINKNDVNAMVSSINDLLNDCELSELLSKNAREKAKDFDWNVVKNQWKNLISR